MKARQAILYVSHKLSEEKSFGSTVLNKVLYYIDHANYLHAGKTVTGFGYIKQVNGPTPEPTEFLLLKREMLASGDLREDEAEYFGRLQRRLVPTSHIMPNVTCFNAEEIALMDNIIESFVGVNARVASELSHDELAWTLARPMENLPHFTYLLTQAPLNSEDIEWGHKTITQHLRESSANKGSTAN